MGVRDDEVSRRFPCDDLVPLPALAAHRGVTVQVEPERVWPRVAQIRLGPYSYDWIDNFGHCSPQQLRDLPEPTTGEHFSVALGRPAGRIASVTSGKQLTGQILGAAKSYVLVPQGAGTRLLLKVVTARGGVVAPVVSVGDLVMARRQLLNWKRLAEGRR